MSHRIPAPDPRKICPGAPAHDPRQIRLLSPMMREPAPDRHVGGADVVSRSAASPTETPGPTEAAADPPGHAPSPGSSVTSPGSGVDAAPAPIASGPRTRLQSGIVKPKVYTDGHVRWCNSCITGEPENLKEAFGDPRWKQAMQEEYDALIRNKTWHLVPPKEARNLIDCKWVYKIKKKSDGTVDRFKARLVGQRL